MSKLLLWFITKRADVQIAALGNLFISHSVDVLFNETAMILWFHKQATHKWNPFPMTPCNLTLSASPKRTHWDASFPQRKTGLLLLVYKLPILWANKWILMTACTADCVMAATQARLGPISWYRSQRAAAGKSAHLPLSTCDTLRFTHTLAASNPVWNVVFMVPLSSTKCYPELCYYQHHEEVLV